MADILLNELNELCAVVDEDGFMDKFSGASQFDSDPYDGIVIPDGLPLVVAGSLMTSTLSFVDSVGLEKSCGSVYKKYFLAR